jgi:hypothetical protein
MEPLPAADAVAYVLSQIKPLIVGMNPSCGNV